MQKDKALEMALGQIEKQYGKGAIMLMGDAASRIQVSVIPTAALSLTQLSASAAFRAEE